MEIKIVENQAECQDFVEKLNLNTFLQSQNWAEFNKHTSKVWQLGIYEKNELVSVCLTIKVTAKRGDFLLVPHGPQYLELDKENPVLLKKYLLVWRNYLKKLGQQEKCNFVRIQPIVEEDAENRLVFSQLEFKIAPMHVHTELTTVLDLTLNYEEILLKMRKTTRQSIKKGLKMVESGEVQIASPSQISEEMHSLYAQTYTRGGAIGYSKDFLNSEWAAFKENKKGKLVTIYSGDKLLSWGMFVICGKRAFYHQGGNLLYKNIPNSYLCQWQGINFAKDIGCISYDFWGVSPEDNRKHPWAKISLFKRGFGGDDVIHLHAQDLVLKWKYYFNWIIEKYRAKKRGFN